MFHAHCLFPSYCGREASDCTHVPQVAKSFEKALFFSGMPVLLPPGQELCKLKLVIFWLRIHFLFISLDSAHDYRQHSLTCVESSDTIFLCATSSLPLPLLSFLRCPWPLSSNWTSAVTVFSFSCQQWPQFFPRRSADQTVQPFSGHGYTCSVWRLKYAWRCYHFQLAWARTLR